MAAFEISFKVVTFLLTIRLPPWLVFLTAHADWVPSLWMDIFDEILDNDNELDYGDQWSLNFNYTQTDIVTKEERKRGWKVYSHCAYGKYVLFYTLNIEMYTL